MHQPWKMTNELSILGYQVWKTDRVLRINENMGMCLIILSWCLRK